MRRLRIPLVVLAATVLLLALVNTSGGRWSSQADQELGGIAANATSNSLGGEPAGLIPVIPQRQALRWCCAFGVEMGVSFVGIPLPFLRVGATLDVDQMRRHHYDGGGAPAEILSVVDEKLDYSLEDVEQNGLIYTCQGGFVDTSHIRELVDWTAFFFAKYDRILETGGAIELEDEGARRTVVSTPVPRALIDRVGRDRVLLTMAQWTAYQTSIWHETAQWYGFSLMPLFPETASGFSPEDPFANAMGIRLLNDIDVREALRSSDSYNRSVEALMVDAVQALGPLPRSVTIDALKALDGVWWDSEVRLPLKAIVIRREFDIDGELEPWLLPSRVGTPELQATLRDSCGADPQPATVRIPDSLGGVAVSEFVSLEIEMVGMLADLPAFAGIDRFDQTSFPGIVERVKAENLHEFGQGSDRPD